jgi:XisI protein
MDKLEYYRHLIRKVLTEYYELDANSTNSTLESALIFDERHDHYLLLLMVHLTLANISVGAKHDRIQHGIITNNLYSVMLRPFQK